jgi:hypothetical protein
MKPRSLIDKIIFAGIIILLIFAPLAFGSVHVWAYSLIEAGVFLLLALWFADCLFVSGSKNLTWVKTPVNLALVMLFVLIGLQLLPRLASVVALISPHTYTDNPNVWWWQSRVGKAHYASGTFIVSNHFAAYMGMLVSLTFGFMIAQKKKSKRLVSGLGGLKSFVQKIINDFSPEASQAKTIFLFFAGVVMAVSLLMSASRGGFLAWLWPCFLCQP